jgi:hypothetical protein
VPRNLGLEDTILLGLVDAVRYCVRLRLLAIPPSQAHAIPPNCFSTFAFTAESIWMNGGLGCSKPSPAIFFVASMPGWLPLAISLVA